MITSTDLSKRPEYTNKFTEVYLAELDYVAQRRKNMGLPSEKVQQVSRDLLDKQDLHDETPSISVKTDLVGLALSGGGIRSATFNLGLLQALAEKKVLHCCDYLSTVSGGGYLGSCLSSLLANTEEASTKAEQFPLRDEREQGEERKEVNHLRATRNYLGLSTNIFNLNNWCLFGLNLLGKMSINMIPLSMLLLFTLLLYMIEPYFYDVLEYFPLGNRLPIWVDAIAIMGIGLILLAMRCVQQQNKAHHSLDSLIGLVMMGIAMSLFLFDLIYTQAWQWASTLGPINSYHAHDIIILCLIVIMLVIMEDRLFFPVRQRFFHIMFPIALIAFLVALTVALLSIVYSYEYDYIQQSLKTSLNSMEKNMNEKENVNQIEVSQAASALGNCCWEQVDKSYLNVEGFFDKVVEDFEGDKKWGDFFNNPSKECKDAVAEKQKRFPKEGNHEKESKNIIFAECSCAVQKVSNENIPWKIQKIMVGMLVVLLLILIILGCNIKFYNFLHDFYRKRLRKTFLIRRKEGEIQPNYDLLLSDLHNYHNGPYHLLNVTLNLPSSTNSFLKGRGTDLFVLSKFYCGAESTGYKRTDCYKDGKSNISLATAMAISGAAASPEMGTMSNPFLALIMTSMNYRLNRWMPNPNPEVGCQKVRFWPIFYFKELLMVGGEKDRWVNLSDGGHYENLGIYSLLKRRCRLIIAVDAGADPELQMKDFANLQCKARIDLGIEIVITDMKKLRLNNERYTQTHFVVGKICYSESARGVLLYIKASMTGDEPEDILSYRRRHPSFPHETTINQFFSETQFESYRKLGQLIGNEVCEKEIRNFEKLKGHIFD